MFEHDQTTVRQLLERDNGFRRLYDKHSSLNRRVDQAAAGTLAMSPDELELLKKEKLMLRDQLQAMIQAETAHH